ncbi:MAG: M24 family metallopeptidase [Bacteroidetes bacterium]|nr:M24 family metallopeptidase [Bacteroidota bacterium]MBS1540262.1 M24 family metallopeptidase [Bacteroidota bacterium]
MKKIFFILLSILTSPLLAQYPIILSQRDQTSVIDELTDDKLKNLLPTLMRREGVDMWVIISREYNEDPVIKTMLPATWMAARRTTMLIAFDKGTDVEFLAVARYDVGKVFKRAWDPDKQPNQWAQLGKLMEERSPKKIAVNKAPIWGHADGISANDYDEVVNALSPKLKSHVVSAERLAVAWLETRSEKEMTIYPQICRIAHQIIAQGFSDQVIQPGVTTTEDVVWFYREEIKKLKLDTWFHPSVEIQRAGKDESTVIRPGDLLHVDFGITYLRLNTDTQQHAYVLKAGETDAPEFLKKAFQKGNRLQDILTSHFKEGKTGNQILADTRQQALAEGITPSIYTHPIGYHGHAAGTTIGMWDMQGGVAGSGDYPMHHRTAYSIELNATVTVAEWRKDIRIMLEEDGYFDETGFRYIDGRQTELIVIPKPMDNVK